MSSRFFEPRLSILTSWPSGGKKTHDNHVLQTQEMFQFANPAARKQRKIRHKIALRTLTKKVVFPSCEKWTSSITRKVIWSLSKVLEMYFLLFFVVVEATQTFCSGEDYLYKGRKSLYFYQNFWNAFNLFLSFQKYVLPFSFLVLGYVHTEREQRENKTFLWYWFL